MTQITKTFEYVESVGSNAWTITHNLGTEYPVVDVWIDAGQTGVDPTDDQKLIPWDITVTDENVVVVTLEDTGGSPNNYTGRALVV